MQHGDGVAMDQVAIVRVAAQSLNSDFDVPRFLLCQDHNWHPAGATMKVRYNAVDRKMFWSRCHFSIQCLLNSTQRISLQTLFSLHTCTLDSKLGALSMRDGLSVRYKSQQMWEGELKKFYRFFHSSSYSFQRRSWPLPGLGASARPGRTCFGVCLFALEQEAPCLFP